MYNISIGIVGVMPPPVGGISTHIKRFSNILENKNLNYKIYDFIPNTNKMKMYNENCRIRPIDNKKIWIIKQLFNCKDDLIHIHYLNWQLIYLYMLIKKIHKTKVIVTLHSFRDDVNNYSKIKKYCFNKALKSVDKFISVGQNEKNKLIAYGCEEKKIKVIPAYVNPIKLDNDYKQLPNNVKMFLGDCDKFIISANGWIKFYADEDLYGLDLLIELIKELNVNNYKVKLMFALLGEKNQNNEEDKYYFKLKKRIKDYNIEENILIYEVENTEFYPILLGSDLLVRPTNTDGYGVSIAEAIHFNVPAIASNVCNRPLGSILFENRNFKDLYNKVVYVIENYDKCKKEVKKIKIQDNSEKIIEIYEELLKDKFKNKRDKNGYKS